jgi:hypothetical protein
MQTVISCSSSVNDYVAGFDESLARAPRVCTCGGRLNGHGWRHRWIVSLAGVFRVPIRRMRCKACGGTVSLLPAIFYELTQCARDLAGRIRSLWRDGFHAMRDVRRMVAERAGVSLALSSMYRWARLPSA